MIEKFKKLNIWVTTIVTWTSFWLIIILPSIKKIFKEAFPLMVNYPFYIFSFLITGVLTIPVVFSIHTYYFQKKEINDMKCRAVLALADVSTTINYKTANIYHNFAIIGHGAPFYSLSYSLMALNEYIEVNDQKMIRQLLNEIIPIIKNIGDALSPANKSALNEIISKIDKQQFSSEIQRINKMI